MVLLADQRYVPTQWAAEVVGRGAYDTAGMVGVHALRWLALTVLIAALYGAARVWAAPTTAAVIALLATVGTSMAWGERPQLAGVAATAVVAWLWSRAWRDDSVPWVTVPLVWLWAMMHGSWILGIAIAGLVTLADLLERGWTAARTTQRLGLVALSIGAVALTPLGPGLLLQPFEVSAAARATVNEWQRPSWGNPLFLLVLILAAVAVLVALRRGRRALPELLVALSAAALSLGAVRTVAFGAVLAALALARSLRVEGLQTAGRREVAPWAVSAVLLAVLPGVVWGGPADGPFGPVVDRAVDDLPTGTHVAVAADASGWVVWRHRDVIPLRDLRVEVYSEPVAEAYEEFAAGDGDWAGYADSHDVQGTIAHVDDALDDAAAAAGWAVVATDGDYALRTRP
jgi:hypothetical protein